MDSSIIVAILALVGTLTGSLAGILTANKLTNYRISELEQKVEKHNAVVERVALLEQSVNSQWKRFDEMKAELAKIKQMIYGGGK